MNDKPVVQDSVNDVTNEDTPITICIPGTDIDMDPLDVTSAFGGPMNGTLTGLNDGDTCFTYTPDPNFNGFDTVSVVVCDTAGACDTSFVIINVLPVNDKPVAILDTIYAVTDLETDVEVCATGIDIDLNLLDISSLVKTPNNGTVTNLGSGDTCITYTPNAGFIGNDTLIVEVCDNGSPILCDTVVIIVEVKSVPLAANDDEVISEDGEVEIDAISNDVDPNNGDLVVTILTQPLFGVATMLNNNLILYLPEIDFCGEDEIVYVVCNQYGECDTATIIVLVTPIDSDFDGIPDYVETRESDFDGDGELDYLSLDSDGDGIPDSEEASDGVIDPCNVILLDCNDDGTPDYLDPTNCQEITPPEGFSPNNDGNNDFFVIEDLDEYPNNHVVILNRWGNKVFEASPYKNDWDGTSQFGVRLGGNILPEGTYFYILKLEKDSQPIKGFIYLKR